MKITSLATAPVAPVSHNPNITKRTLLAYGEFPPLTNFSQATFPPGETVAEHTHPDMLEVFLVQSGRGKITIDGHQYALEPGGCIAVPPGEAHALINDGDAENLVVTYFGIQYSDTGR